MSTACLARNVLQEGARRLQEAGVSNARHEAEWLLSGLTGERTLDMYLQDPPLPDDTVARFVAQVEARASGAPLQYLLGEAEFFGERFAVAPGVFIPRPETEAVVAEALQALRVREATLGRPLRLLDLGTGSGCIAVTLARELPTCVVVGVELSWNALCLARQNVLRHGLEARVHLVRGSWLSPICGLVDGVLANPPYIPSAQVDRLPLDVRQEPRLSLDGGERGTRDLFHLLAEVPRILRRGGLLAMECGEEQVAELSRAAVTQSWVQRSVALHDLGGHPRGILITQVS